MTFVPRGLPTGIGSLPFKDEKQAVSFVATRLPEIPFWPQLPKKDFRESMYIQYSEGLPGVTFAGGRMYIDTSRDLTAEMEEFYRNYLEGKSPAAPFGPSYAEGFYAFLAAGDEGLFEGGAPKYPSSTRRSGGAEPAAKRKRGPLQEPAVAESPGSDGGSATTSVPLHTPRPIQEAASPPLAVKGQVTGPVSFGLAVTDQDKKLILYNQVYMDLVVKNLQSKARWQEEKLRQVHPQTIIFVDEPYLSTYGSGYFNYERETVIRYLNEVMEGIQGLKGVHCCGNTDWSILLATPVDILSFDAYAYSKSFSLYAPALANFLAGGGVIAWGIVPATIEEAKKEDPPALLKRLEEAMGLLRAQGIPWTQLVEQSLITPACGLGSQDEDGAEHIFALTRQVSDLFREKYRLD